MTPTTQADPTQDQIIELLRDSVEKLLAEHVDEDANFEKLLQFMRLRKADYYWKGIQYIAPDLSPTGVIDYTPVGSPLVGANGEDRRGLLDYNIDQVKTYGRKFIATLGQRPFYNQKAVPDNPHSEADRMAAREAEKGYYLLRSQWNVKIKNLELPYHAWKSGTIYPYTRYVVDSNKYGWAEEPIIEKGKAVIEPGGYQCPMCGAKEPELATTEIPDEFGAPQISTACATCSRPLDATAWVPPVEADVPIDTGRMKKYPNGRVELHFLTGFFITVPFYSMDMGSVPFLEYRGEEHVGRLIALYPKLRDKFKNGDLNISPEGGQMQQTGMLARSTSESQVGLPRNQANKSRITYSRTWVRPFLYEMVQDEEKRAVLKARYPDGLKVVRVGKEVVNLAHEKLDDYFCAVYPEVGEYIFRDGISWGIFQHQDAINDTFNQLAEIVERCNAIHLAHSDVIDIDALADRPNSAVEWIGVAPGTDLERSVKTLPTSSFPKEGTQLIGIFKENLESHTGVVPEVFGGAAPTQTAEQSRNNLNQALMQLGTTGEFMTQGWTQIFTNGIWELARNSPRNPEVPGTGEMIDLEVLQSGKWHLEGEMGIPRSFAERKDELKTLVTQNPEMAKALHIDAPVNAGAVRDYLDLPDLEDPADDERQFVAELIDELLQGEPIQQSPMGPGMPAQPPMPSSTRILDLVDAGILDPANTAELIREWVVSMAGRKAQGNPGFENVMAVMRMLKQIMMPPPVMGPDGQPLPPEEAPPEGGPPPSGKPPAVNNKQVPTGQQLPASGVTGAMSQGKSQR